MLLAHWMLPLGPGGPMIWSFSGHHVASNSTVENWSLQYRVWINCLCVFSPTKGPKWPQTTNVRTKKKPKWPRETRKYLNIRAYEVVIFRKWFFARCTNCKIAKLHKKMPIGELKWEEREIHQTWNDFGAFYFVLQSPRNHSKSHPLQTFRLRTLFHNLYLTVS